MNRWWDSDGKPCTILVLPTTKDWMMAPVGKKVNEGAALARELIQRSGLKGWKGRREGKWRLEGRERRISRRLMFPSRRLINSLA